MDGGGGKERAAKARLLVVDDSPSIIRMTTMLLSAAGYEVDAASSGEEAFEKFFATGHDLVVSDITMGALSGVQLCRLIRNDPASAEVPVVLLTGADDPRSRFWARSAGATAYVAKEAMRHTLVPEVKRALSRNGDEGRRPVPAPQPRSAIDRLCRVLDDLLFDAVIASEVRQLVGATDRKAFARSITELASDVATYAYLLVRLEGPKSPTYVLHARDGWPADEKQAFLAMGLPDDVDIETIATGPTGSDVEFAPGDLTTFPIQASQENLGQLAIFSGSRPLASGDRNTLALLAQELGTVAKTQFLMEQTKLLAQTDALTQLYNRRHTSATLEAEVERSNRYATSLSVLMCDIDHFKSINDRFGHNAGDEVIRQVAKVLGASIRRIDMAGRWGGEEFVILLPSTPLDEAAVVGERIRTAIESLGPASGTPERITVSVGVAEHERRKNAIELVEQADKSLYRAKQLGRNRVEVSIPPNGETEECQSSQVQRG
jgi:two-component system cell cycle response regulator